MNNKKKYLIAFLVLTMVLLSCLSQNPTKVRADSNYSNYLTSEAIGVKNDRALILLEESGSSNNYRNYYETGFLFPSKLRDEMYSTDLTTNPAKYYVQQAYLSDLDSEYAFKDIDNLGQYETNDYIDNYTDIIENSGYYDSTIKESYFIPLIPNENIQNESESYLNYSRIDDYGIVDDGEYVAFSWLPDRKLQYGFTDYNFTEFNSDIIKISVYYEIYTAGGQQYPNNKIRTWLTNNGTYNEYYDFDLSTIWTTYYITHDYYQFNNLLSFDNLTIQLDMVLGESISHIKKGCLKVYVNQTNKILGSNDYNYYNYETEISGASGLFPAEYSFTSDSDGSNPAGWSVVETYGTVDVVSDLDGHSKIIEIDDTSSGGYVIARNEPSAQTSGTVEYWWYSTDTEKDSSVILKSNTDSALLIANHDDEIGYYGAGWSKLTDTVDNTWYHIRIDFECGSGGYEGLSADRFHIYINDVKYSNLLFFTGRTSVNRIELTSTFNGGGTDLSYQNYFDAVDYSWSTDYFFGRNKESSSYQLNVSSSLGIERTGNDFDNIELLELEYTVKSNESCNLDLYLYNIFSETYDLIETKSITTSFQEFSYSFDLNYTYYSTLGNTNFTFYLDNSLEALISFDKINLKATFSNFSLNSNGYHNINLKYNRETSGSVNRGNISFNMKLYKDYFEYDYIENNVIETDYSRLNQVVDFSNNLTQIYECEVQYHIRYGLNTLDIDIVNVLVIVIINYNFTFELFEQLRFGNNDGNYLRAEFSYDSMNFNRLNNTGIFGNYSSNCLSGLRVLRGTTAINYNRYFTIPFFNEKISLIYNPSGASTGSGSEPELPSGYYWEYETFRLSDYGNTVITVENWSVDFNQVYAEKYTAKYPYNPKTVREKDLGSWSFKIGNIKVSFNFIRNALANIINLVFLFFQYLGYFILSGASYIVMYIGVNILVLIWNYLIFYIFIALIWIFWYIYSGLVYLMYGLWDLLLYIYENVLIPAYIWITEVAVPYLVEFVIIPAVAFTLTLIIWILTLGRLDFWELYAVIKEQLFILSDGFNIIVLELIEHIVSVIIFIALYLLLIGMCYVKMLVVKVRGYVNRSQALESSLDTYLFPIIIFYKICLAIKQLIANWF